MDGLCFSDHSPTPGLTEYKKAIEPVQTTAITDNRVTVVNRYDMISLDHLQCTWTVVSDGSETEKKEVAIPAGETCSICVSSPVSDGTGIKPHEEATLVIDGLEHPPTGVAYLTMSFTLRQATTWAPAGHEVAFGQLQLGRPMGLASWRTLVVPGWLQNRPLAEMTAPSLLSIHGADGSEWVFDLAAGSISSWTQATDRGRNIITEPMALELYRALTDNDKGGIFGQQWLAHRVHQAKTHVVQTSWVTHRDSGVVEVSVTSRVAPPVLSWALAVDTTYRFSGRDISVRMRVQPEGETVPPTISRLGLRLGLADVDTVRWFGRGPGESYCDKKLSQRAGNWESDVDGLSVDYEFPQDNSNRTDVHWVEFLGRGRTAGKKGRLLRARFGDAESGNFQALRYSTQDLDAARHPHELLPYRRADTLVHLDWTHHGLGTGSCGPSTLPAYQLRTNRPFDVEMLLD